MGTDPDFARSRELSNRLHQLVPGGAHTYAKGDDQYPEDAAPILTRGRGCRVWDADGNEFIEFGSGLRAVTLGHGHPAVTAAVCEAAALGTNFTRPSALELECAEAFLAAIRTADMVKFAKNGSDATTAAVKLARAFTGRDLVAVCADQPFLSTDDWFIGSTPMPAGIPQAIRDLTVKFRYNQPATLEELFERHRGRIACVIMEAETSLAPEPGFLQTVHDLCRAAGALFIIDEMITGFRWHAGGAQAFHGLRPDLSTFGKALGNGISIAALAGRRDVMELGGLRHARERVFLLSTTHGAESIGLAAACAVLRVYREEPIVETMWERGRQLADGMRRAVADLELTGHVGVLGQPCNLVYFTRDQEGRPSQEFRTLFMRELIRRGILGPSFVVNAAHTPRDIEITVERVHDALQVYQRALAEGVPAVYRGRSVKPALRQYN